MPARPILIFDKSALQALSIDEAVWLDNFFQSNLTPLFLIETLPDLEKEIKGGKRPEDVSEILLSRLRIGELTRMPTTGTS